MKLFSVTKAEEFILATAKTSRTDTCRLSVAIGRVLAENITADRDQPAADRSSMDGVAINFNSWQMGYRDFRIAGTQKAGVAQKTLKRKNECFEIMTGAVIAKGCDCVIPIESVRIFKDRALVNSNTQVKRFQFIRKQGSEYKKGTLLIPKGITINATHISVTASVGKNKIKVFSPKIAVIGTGDELVELDKKPQNFQSRRSNAYALEAIFKSRGFTDVKSFHLNDNFKQLKKELKKILKAYDVLVLSGGVSMGKFDLIPEVLTALGVKTVFHKVSQKPGKPLLFAKSKKGKVVFGLPGNPVSTMVCAVRYVVPYLQKACGTKINHVSTQLSKSVKQNPNLTLFLPVSFNKDVLAVPIQFAGSGDYGSLTHSAGFVEITQGSALIQKGKRVKFFQW